MDPRKETGLAGREATTLKKVGRMPARETTNVRWS
jgi:hypothetical protein